MSQNRKKKRHGPRKKKTITSLMKEKLQRQLKNSLYKKIEDLKDNIYTSQIKDPTIKLQEKVKSKNLTFTL